MPELPEIETTKRGITPHLLHQSILEVVVRQTQLRLPIPPQLNALCSGKVVRNITRRAKYLLLDLSDSHLLIHLGMSGHLRIVDESALAGKHDHVDLYLVNGKILRYNDPRRFGLWLHLIDNPLNHRLLSHLGPEPLTEEFNGEYLYSQAKNKSQCIKTFIMTNSIVVGVGNIYAAESLFLAGIHPKTITKTITKEQMISLSDQIKRVLRQAIEVGGTTLRDFYGVDGKPGYFVNELKIYGRQNEACHICKTTIESLVITGRNSAFCPRCQPYN